jgi:hypothetical protein
MSEHTFQVVRPQHAIPPRDERAASNMVDLSSHYLNALDDEIHHKPANTLAGLPAGLQSFVGVQFDVRGVIQLAGKDSQEITHVIYPEAVQGIGVRCSGKELHFLHAAAWAPEDGQLEIGAYVLHYADGESRSIPLVYHTNTSDWWARPSDPVPAEAPVAWEGSNPRVEEMGFVLRLFVYTCPNPLPEVEIASMDFVSNMVHSAPMLLAITID